MMKGASLWLNTKHHMKLNDNKPCASLLAAEQKDWFLLAKQTNSTADLPSSLFQQDTLEIKAPTLKSKWMGQ